LDCVLEALMFVKVGNKNEQGDEPRPKGLPAGCVVSKKTPELPTGVWRVYCMVIEDC